MMRFLVWMLKHPQFIFLVNMMAKLGKYPFGICIRKFAGFDPLDIIGEYISYLGGFVINMLLLVYLVS